MSPNSRRHVLIEQAQASTPESAAVGEAGPVLEKPPDMTWTDYLHLLLQVGAEIEHALMVEYLYAAYSLGGEQVPEKRRPVVQRWRENILMVAREEMGHLLTVQNLLCLLGSPLALDREDYPWDTPFYPFKFRLSPLTKDSLARYVYAEMPPEDMMEDATEAEKRVRAEVVAYLEETSEGPLHPVSEIYDTILEIVRRPELIPDAAFRPETYSVQASWDEWGKGYRAQGDAGKAPPDAPGRANVIVEQMGTRTEAVAALRAVAGQGEAPHLKKRGIKHPTAEAPSEPSHFERFAHVYAELVESGGAEEPPTWKATRDVPINPTTVRGEGEEDPDDPSAAGDLTYIGSEASRTWARLFDLRYRMLLTYLAHTYRLGRSTPGDRPGPRGVTLHHVFAEMYNLKTIAGLLVRMPLTDDPADPRRAGPPFRMPYTLSLPEGEGDCWRLHRDLLAASSGICAEIAATRQPDALRYVQTLRDLDADTVAWLDSMLAGCGPRGSSRP